MRTIAITLLTVGLSALHAGAQEPAAIVQMADTTNEPIGTAEITETAQLGVFIELDVEGLSPGVHAFHIHETGSCGPEFDASGGHYAPEGRSHGLLHPEGAHAGDLLNLTVPPSGAVTAERLARDVTLEPGPPPSLLDDDGSALVIHAGADDYISQPSGAAGARVACGVITR